MNCLSCVVVLAFVGSAFALSGQFIPKSIYILDQDEYESGVHHTRTRRDLPFDSLDRVRRSPGGGSSSASSYSSASASSSSSSSSGGGGGGAPIYFGDDSGYVPPNYGQGGYSALNYNPNFPPGATIFSRFGEEAGSGIQASGSAQGPKGAFSAVSTSSQDGKVQYAVKSGKI